MRSLEGLRLVLHLASPRPRLLCGETQNVLFFLVNLDPSRTHSSGPVFLTSAFPTTGHGHLSRPPHVCLAPSPLVFHQMGPVLIYLFWQLCLFCPVVLRTGGICISCHLHTAFSSFLPQTFIRQLPLCQGLCWALEKEANSNKP